MRSAAAFRAPMLLLALRGVSGAAAALRAPMLLLAMRSVSGAVMPVRTASVRLLSTAPAISETQKAAMAFLDGSPDPFHACARARERLEAAGFVELDEREPWAGRIAPGGRYFWTRNRSCLVAFAVGEGYEPGDGFKIIGAHTDSPNLKVKPRSRLQFLLMQAPPALALLIAPPPTACCRRCATPRSRKPSSCATRLFETAAAEVRRLRLQQARVVRHAARFGGRCGRGRERRRAYPGVNHLI